MNKDVIVDEHENNGKAADAQLLSDSANDTGFQRHASESPYRIGQWVLVREESTDASDITPANGWLGCVMHIGSNVLCISGIRFENGSQMDRVHLDDAWKQVRIIDNAKEIIRNEVSRLQADLKSTLEEIQSITAMLGVSPSEMLLPGSGEAGTGLAVLSGQMDINRYEVALKHAAEKQLPDLFEKVKKTNSKMASWMSAEILPMRAVAGTYQNTISTIKDRIFNVSLYAGLTERCSQIRDGQPAAFTEKLHVMQRRLYMDEECLAGYKDGGIDAESILTFDEWLCQPEQFERILPFPRCVVAFRVRRTEKERNWDGSLRSLIKNIQLANEDKMTFLYIRNGEQIYWLQTDIDFGEMLFPESGLKSLTEPMMVKMFVDKVDKVMSVREYDDLAAEIEKNKAARDKWFIDNPLEKWAEKHGYTDLSRASAYWHASCPIHRHYQCDSLKGWKPFDDDHLFRDEIAQWVDGQIKQYNRIALILQGLFDRSPVLNPHPPVKTWTADGFEQAIKLVRDSDLALYHGEKPDWESYRQQCNAKITSESWLYGQRRAWQKKEAEKEQRRTEYDRVPFTGKIYTPYDNPGPDVVMQPAAWRKRSKTAQFCWERDRKRPKTDYWGREIDSSPIQCKLVVDADDLFNVSAYTPGDLQKFFRDPRTREDYLPWAEALVFAEEFHAKLKSKNGGGGHG